MNDSKYGRLYPERAVKPLLDLAFSLINDGRLGHTTHDALRAAVIDLHGLSFPEDEPLFLLRGQDALAPWAVRHYAGDVAMSEAFGGQLSSSQVDTIHHLEELADRMQAWEPRKNPD
jgi:hypothetical protein